MVQLWTEMERTFLVFFVRKVDVRIRGSKPPILPSFFSCPSPYFFHKLFSPFCARETEGKSPLNVSRPRGGGRKKEGKEFLPWSSSSSARSQRRVFPLLPTGVSHFFPSFFSRKKRVKKEVVIDTIGLSGGSRKRRRKRQKKTCKLKKGGGKVRKINQRNILVRKTILSF